MQIEDIIKKEYEVYDLKKKEYILLSAHREENIDTDSNFKSLFNSNWILISSCTSSSSSIEEFSSTSC